MQKILLSGIFSAFCLCATAQITVTNATFPVAGDTLHFGFDENPVGFNPATAPGGNQTWDFTGLVADNTTTVSYQSANTGMNASDYPGAELVQPGAAGDSYINITANKMEIMGYAGGDPTGLGVDVLAKFSPAYSERTVPLNFFDINSSISNLSIPFSTNLLPDSVLALLPIAPDSLRTRTTINRVEVVDGWGTCQIPGGSYPVLRLKRTEYTTTNIDAHISSPFPLGWIDLSQILGGTGIGQLIGTDTTVTYHFLSNTQKEEIAVATMANDLSSVTRFRFKSNPVSAVFAVHNPGNAAITAAPNPAADRVQFECSNLPQDDYTLKIFNILGSVVWKADYYQMGGDQVISVDLEKFTKGIYLYSLSTKNGKVIGTKRLIVLKP
jgi:hypothetical protein